MNIFKHNPRVQDIVVGDRLPACAGEWAGWRVVEVFHGHYIDVGNYARFKIARRFQRDEAVAILDISREVEFRFGRSWKASI